MEVVSVMSGVRVCVRPRPRACCSPPYIGHGDALAYRRSGRRGAAVTVILIGLGAGGCSFSRSGGDGPFAKMGDSEVTGSIGDPPAPLPTDADLAFARNAASDVLTKGDKDSSQPW